MKKNEIKKLKIGLYDPFLDTLGGGEKHILSIIGVLAGQGSEISIFWDKNLTSEINNRFSLHSLKTLKWLPNIFEDSSPLRTLKTLRTFDYFFYVTDGSYFFSGAKNNFVFCMVPDKKLYNLNLLNRLKLWNYRYISNSPFTTGWLTKWGIEPVTIAPCIDNIYFSKNGLQKKKIILSVGRFFSHLHSKNQEKIIRTYMFLKKSYPEFKDYKLVLAGGLKDEDRRYFEELKKITGDRSDIELKPNLQLNKLYQLYKLSTYFWHFTGFGVNENLYPDRVEHFGIAPLEAAAAGCLVFCHNSGGLKALFTDNKTGFLFDDEKALLNKMAKVENNQELKESVIKNGKIMIKNKYSYQIFKDRVLKTVFDLK